MSETVLLEVRCAFCELGQRPGTVTGANRGPLLEPDGTTAFSAQPAPFQVVAGEAQSLELVVPDAAPAADAPAPDVPAPAPDASAGT